MDIKRSMQPPFTSFARMKRSTTLHFIVTSQANANKSYVTREVSLEVPCVCVCVCVFALYELTRARHPAFLGLISPGCTCVMLQ